jgi:hypothetical protein
LHLALPFAVLLLIGCRQNPEGPDGSVEADAGVPRACIPVPGDEVHPPTAGTWDDLGSPSGQQGLTLALTDGEVLLGTTDGVWRRVRNGSSPWARAGLEGNMVRALLVVPGQDGGLALFAGTTPSPSSGRPESLYRSDDEGTTWVPRAQGLSNPQEGFIGVAQLKRQPGAEADGVGVLFAALSGSTLVRSANAGESWEVIKGEPAHMASYDCVLHLADGHLYQGCEAPLDFAWIERRLVDGSGAPSKVVASEDIGNRRPNSFASSFASPGRVYAGLEGAVICIDAEGWGWRFQAPRDGPYLYVTAIWIDPTIPDHLIFGGFTQDENVDFPLMEVFAAEGSARRVGPPPVMGTDPRIWDGKQDGDALFLLVGTRYGTQPDRVLVWLRHLPSQ